MRKGVETIGMNWGSFIQLDSSTNHSMGMFKERQFISALRKQAVRALSVLEPLLVISRLLYQATPSTSYSGQSTESVREVRVKYLTCPTFHFQVQVRTFLRGGCFR
jgi:hypothetical protein